MNKSKITILLLFLVMILAISAVSAADTNDTSDSVVQAVDEAPIDEVASEDPVLSATDDADLLGAGEANFTSLQTAIDGAGDSITLDSDYIRADGESDISISKDFTINGNNHKIDANQKGGIFNVQSGCTLTLKNVTLINGNADRGAAVYNNGDLTVIDSKFLNNTAVIAVVQY